MVLLQLRREHTCTNTHRPTIQDRGVHSTNPDGSLRLVMHGMELVELEANQKDYKGSEILKEIITHLLL